MFDGNGPVRKGSDNNPEPNQKMKMNGKTSRWKTAFTSECFLMILSPSKELNQSKGMGHKSSVKITRGAIVTDHLDSKTFLIFKVIAKWTLGGKEYTPFRDHPIINE